MANQTLKNGLDVKAHDRPAIQTACNERTAAATRSRVSPLVCTVMAGLGIFGGVSSLFAGVISAVIHGLLPSYGLDRGSTVLLVIAIPMILIGSVFLDEVRLSRK